MFGLNNAQLIGRLGADATISHLTNGGRVANVSIATDESYLDKNSGDKVDRTEWHRIVTFQDGLVEMMEKHAKKGAWSTSRASCRPASGARTARTATASRPRSCWSPAAGCNSWISRTATAHRQRTAIPCLQPKPPRRWMTAKFRSKRASSLPHNSGPVPAKLGMGLALYFCRRVRACLHRVPKALTRSGRAARSAPAALTVKSSRRA